MTVEPLAARPLPSEIVDGSAASASSRGMCRKSSGHVRSGPAVFPYSSRSDGQLFVNDYRQPESLRYTVNTLLGLARAAKAGIGDYSEAEVRVVTESFIRLHGAHLGSDADRGLLLLLIVELRAAGEPCRSGLLDRIRTSLEATGLVPVRHAGSRLDDLGRGCGVACRSPGRRRGRSSRGADRPWRLRPGGDRDASAPDSPLPTERGLLRELHLLPPGDARSGARVRGRTGVGALPERRSQGPRAPGPPGRMAMAA